MGGEICRVIFLLFLLGFFFAFFLGCMPECQYKLWNQPFIHTEREENVLSNILVSAMIRIWACDLQLVYWLWMSLGLLLAKDLVLKDVTYLILDVKFGLWNGEDRVLVLEQFFFFNCLFLHENSAFTYCLSTDWADRYPTTWLQVTPTTWLQALCTIVSFTFLLRLLEKQN